MDTKPTRLKTTKHRLKNELPKPLPRSEDRAVSKARKRRLFELRASESEDWLSDSEGELGDIDGLEQAEDSPYATDVQSDTPGNRRS